MNFLFNSAFVHTDQSCSEKHKSEIEISEKNGHIQASMYVKAKYKL